MNVAATANADRIDMRGLNRSLMAIAALVLAGSVLFACGGRPGHGVGSSDWFGAGNWTSGHSDGGSGGGGDGGE